MLLLLGLVLYLEVKMQLPVVQSIAVCLGLCRNYMAEMSAVIIGLEWAKNKGYRRIIVASDSLSDVLYIANGNLPWDSYAPCNKRYISLQMC